MADGILPIFKSHYSIGRSILTLQKTEELQENAPNSIIDLCPKNNIKNLVLVEDNMSGLLQAYMNSRDAKLNLTFGLKLRVCNDCEEKTTESLNKTCKYIIFAKNKEGFRKLIHIFSFAAKEGFYYSPRVDFDTLSRFWRNKDLMMAVPFYDSFIFNNILLDFNCVPEIDFFNPVFFLEDNGLPFDGLIKERVEAHSKGKFETQRVKSIYYNNREDFKTYLTFRCINNRTTLSKPNLDHMCSNEFCLESWKETQ